MNDILVLILFVASLIGSTLVAREARKWDNSTGVTVHTLSVMLAVINAIGIAKWVLIVL